MYIGPRSCQIISSAIPPRPTKLKLPQHPCHHFTGICNVRIYLYMYMGCIAHLQSKRSMLDPDFFMGLQRRAPGSLVRPGRKPHANAKTALHLRAQRKNSCHCSVFIHLLKSILETQRCVSVQAKRRDSPRVHGIDNQEKRIQIRTDHERHI